MSVNISTKLKAAVFGSATDAPSTDAEGATARSVVSLLKGIKNYLRTLTLGTVGFKDAGPLWTSAFGVSGAAFASADASAAAAAVTDAPTGSQKLVITDLFISLDTALTVTFTEETSAVVIWKGYLPASCGIIQLTPRGKFKLATVDKKLMVQTSAAGNIAVTAGYYSEA